MEKGIIAGIRPWRSLSLMIVLLLAVALFAPTASAGIKASVMPNPFVVSEGQEVTFTYTLVNVYDFPINVYITDNFPGTDDIYDIYSDNPIYLDAGQTKSVENYYCAAGADFTSNPFCLGICAVAYRMDGSKKCSSTGGCGLFYI